MDSRDHGGEERPVEQAGARGGVDEANGADSDVFTLERLDGEDHRDGPVQFADDRAVSDDSSAPSGEGERDGGARGAQGDRAPSAPGDTGGARAGRRKRDDNSDVVFETFRLEVGHTHGVKPGNIVGAIANEAGLEGRHIGHVDIRDDHSFVDLPEGMPRDIFRNLKKVRVVGQELRISRVDGKPPRQH
jgi:ATP-dependent RNA helicase DeaD